MSESNNTQGGKKEAEEVGHGAPPEVDAGATGTPEEDPSDEAGRTSPFGDVEGFGGAREELLEAEPEAPPHAKRRRGRRLIAALVVLAAVFVAGLVAWPLAAPRLSAYLPAGLVFGGAMVDKVEALESRVSSLEATVGRRDPALDRLEAGAAATAKTVAAADTRIAALESADSAARLEGLASRIESLEGAAPKRDERLAAKVNDLTVRLQALEAGLARQGGDGSGAGAAAAAAMERIASVERALNEAQDRNEQLAAQLATVEKTSSRLAGDLATQTQRVAGLEEKAATQEVAQKAAISGDARGAALALAVGQLRAALISSAPFERELSAFDPLVAGAGEGVRKALDALRPLAPTGVPTLATLQTRFEDTAAAVVRATVTQGDDWMSRTLARLSSLVTVRRTGEVAGSDPAAVVARAEQRLGEGDLGAAVAEMDSLTGAPAKAAAGWLSGARRRLAADAAVEDLYAAAVSTLGR